MFHDPLARDTALPNLLAEVFPQSRPETRTALVNTASIQKFGTGQTMFRQGDSTPVALVMDGHVAIRRTSPDGRQLIVRIVRRGKLGAFFPINARPSAADLVALTPTPVALWAGPWFRSLARSDPGLAVDLLDHVLITYEEVVGRLDSLIYQDALRRVARILHLHADLFFADDPVLTRDYLPTLVGTSREMTGRVLRILEARSLVARVGRDRLRLLDPAGLAEAAADPEP
ncbi:MAG TPA: Crp/Fnr family transcriptional regulator [Verrucomicrobiae bacterium]|nr:Crp/Fnr family transcriptional regulator [Verrucomicrobiae bacterium]